MKVTVANYGIGNLLSVRRALEHVGGDVSFAENADDILRAERLVVPGVGAFHKCMGAITRNGIHDALLQFAASGRPYLGICVGMQMLMTRGFEFGEHAGLGLIPGDVRRIDVAGERVPFIGWKRVELCGRQNQFYFVHSYQALPDDPASIAGAYSLGGCQITAAVRRDNILGLQFHPEKSGEDGLRLIGDFLAGRI